MAMTISATIPTHTNWYGGFAFQILVVTGGLTGGNSNATGSGGSGNADITLTPAQSKSLLCWMAADTATGITYTPAASNTIQSQDTAGGWGFGYYTGTVTAGTGATVGAAQTGGAGTFCNMAVELVPAVAGVTPVIAASTPALVQVTGTTTYTATTAPFTPPAGAVLVALCAANNYSSGTGLAPAVTDSTGLTWTARRSQAGTVSVLPMVIATTVVPVPCAATFGGAGTVAAAVVVAGHATLTGVGAVTAVGAYAGTATVTGAATVTAAATVAGVTELDGTGAIAGYANSQSAELDGAAVLTAVAAGPGGTEMDAVSYLAAMAVVDGAIELDGQGGLGAEPAIVYSALLAGETGMNLCLA